jgi:phosphatidylserine/phosphatidylglycerophosphate/cardiolipin synthase-like enzyme
MRRIDTSSDSKLMEHSPMNTDDQTTARACLVESIPKGLEDLRGTPGVQYTEEVLVRLTRAARSTIDLTAMYWSLLPDPTGADESGFTPEQFAAMGAGTGRALYEALREAAARGVRFRILESPGFSQGKSESATLKEEYPDRIEIHQVNMSDWYGGGGGIMHQKIWIFDGRHIYLGSANMDWRSITQVKEMGVAVEDCPELAADATKYFDGWCTFSALPRRASPCTTRGRVLIAAFRRGHRWCRRISGRSRRSRTRDTARPVTGGRRLWSRSTESRAAYSSRAARTRCAGRVGATTAAGWSTPSMTRASPCP